MPRTDGYDSRDLPKTNDVRDVRDFYSTYYDRQYNNLSIQIEEDSECETLQSLSKLVEHLDPDIILTRHGDEFFFPYLIGISMEINCLS